MVSQVEHDAQSGTVAQAATRLAEELARIQVELAGLASKLIASPSASAQLGEGSWKRLRERRASADALFAELEEALEDRSDTEEAEKALTEPGESIPWQEIKGELDPS